MVRNLGASGQRRKQRILRSAALAAMALLLTLPATAQLVERIAKLATRDVQVVLPGFEDGAWRTRVQLVWDPTTQSLMRRSYTLWDPLASEPLDFFWTPENVAADRGGRLTGRGRVGWRSRGAPSYDPGAGIAAYRGEMLDGRAEGQGEYLHRSGVSYKGAWRGGLMDGEGRLSLPNGDQYVGGFQKGRLHGDGVYIDATGTKYEGGFAAGFRQGEGVVHVPDGQVFRAVWQAGRELPGSRRLVSNIRAGLANVQYDQADDLRIGVLVDKMPALSDDVSNDRFKRLEYTAESEAETLKIFPGEPRLLDVWRGRAEIQLIGEEYSELDYYYLSEKSFLGSRLRYGPVALVFELENRAEPPVRIVGALLDVTKSESDLEPAIDLTVEARLQECAGTDISSPVFNLENYGWSDAKSAKVRFSFASNDGREFAEEVSRDIGPITREARVDLTQDLERLGVSTENLSREQIPCSHEEQPTAEADSDRRPFACLDAAKAKGMFGKLVPFVYVDGFYVGVSVKGVLEYDWRDVAGSDHAKTSSFSQPLRLGTLDHLAECGEGGAPKDVSAKPFQFDLDKKDYRIAVPLKDDVPGGVTGRWRITLDARKSSHHAFRIVLQLADGRRVASRPLDFLYFKPSR